jgi:hypothetical protein
VITDERNQFLDAAVLVVPSLHSVWKVCVLTGHLSYERTKRELGQEQRKQPMSLKCRFAVGAEGLASSGVWTVKAKKGSLYCMVTGTGGELKSSIHPPGPDWPEGKRHWGFTDEASSEVAKAAKGTGSRHKLEWPGRLLAPGYRLEWRIIFRGSSLRNVPISVKPNVTLLPIPRPHEQLEVVVIVGPSEAIKPPRGEGATTHLLAEGCLPDGRRVWIVYGIWTASQMTEMQITGRAYAAKDFETEAGELRAVACGVQADGSLAFWDARVERQRPA